MRASRTVHDVFSELMATGAVISGRRTFELAGREIEIHLVPVLLGGGRHLFEALGPDHVELELVRRLEGRDVTHLRYRVRHGRAHPAGHPNSDANKPGTQ